MNSIQLVGRIGKDAEVKHFDDGGMSTSFTMATNDGYGDRRITTWHNIRVSGEYGNKLSRYLKKGKEVGVVGTLRINEYERQDGTKAQFYYVMANQIDLLGSKSDDGSSTTRSSSTKTNVSNSSNNKTLVHKEPINNITDNIDDGVIDGYDDAQGEIDDLPF